MPPDVTPEDPTTARGAGVLLHVTSLPEGRLGPEAFRFVDWLADAGQRWWQVLPLTPPDRHGSPYASRSAFAASPALLARPRARVTAAALADFRERNAYWIGDWARVAGRDAVADQVRFEREWGSLRDHANDRGVRIMGDLPFYVAPHAADVRAHPGLFRRDAVAGVPPDYFTADGQLWGNPTYDWAAMRRGRPPLVDRAPAPLARSGRLASASITSAPSWPLGRARRGARTARAGRWHPGPGTGWSLAARAALGPLPLVAEDLGVITAPVDGLLDRLGLPGMRVLQFAFPGDAGQPPPAREPPPRRGRLHRHPRQRHGGGVVGVGGRAGAQRRDGGRGGAGDPRGRARAG